jgi:hypothetical protein
MENEVEREKVAFHAERCLESIGWFAFAHGGFDPLFPLQRTPVSQLTERNDLVSVSEHNYGE